jgi:hypothetical protein
MAREGWKPENRGLSAKGENGKKVAAGTRRRKKLACGQIRRNEAPHGSPAFGRRLR